MRRIIRYINNFQIAIQNLLPEQDVSPSEYFVHMYKYTKLLNFFEVL